MQPRQYTTVDRTDWPSGPWDSEPDKMQWQDQATGLPCLIVRNPPLGFLCGYVGVAEGHPCFGKTYGDEAIDELAVHGGVTFTEFCDPTATEAEGICHMPDLGEPDRVWWLGFDSGHAFDHPPMDPFQRIIKKYGASLPRELAEDASELGTLFPRTYRDVVYMQAQCARLASQLAPLHA